MKHGAKDKRTTAPAVLAGFSILSIAFLSMTVGCNERRPEKPNVVTKEAPKPEVVAKIGGEEITLDNLIGDSKVDYFDIKKREYDFKMSRLNEIMAEKLIGAEAKKANMTYEEFVEKKVAHGTVSISDKDYKKFVLDKHIPEAQITPQIKERIMSYLQTTKKQDAITRYVSQLTKANPVEIYFTKPKMQVNVEVGKAPVYGKSDAPVTIIEWSDFECPYCSRAAETVSEIKKKYGHKVKIAFKHFPLPMHKDAKPAAEASMCVNDQGSDKFWKFHDAAFKNQDKLDKDNLEKFAIQAGADKKQYQECLASSKFKSFVEQDMNAGEKLGVRSTPTFFVNGQLLSGALPVDSFSEVIDEELKMKD